jgi:Transposase DDE domain
MSIETLTSTILSKMSNVGKWQANFFIDLTNLWLGLKGRYHFENLSRQGYQSSETYRANFSKPFDFKAFNLELFKYLDLEKIWVFDPTFLNKSGKKTPGIGYFWSGCKQQISRGIELAGLAIVDVKNHSCFHYYATQTILSEGQDLLTYYAELLVKDACNLLNVSKYVAVDAYFSKKSFIDSVKEAGLDLITRMRNDAVMYYAYTGPQRTGRGRKRKFAGKIDAENLDLSQFRACLQEDDWTAFEGLAYAKALKRWVKTVVVQNYKADGSIKNCKIFIATDLTMTGTDLYLYYHLRFQIEFVYRDAKQHLGLTQCQSTQQQRLDFHHNFALTLLSLVKVVHWLSQPLENRKPFSIQNIKAQYFNERFLNLFFDVFGICPEQKENNPKIATLINYAKIAA